MNIKQQFNELSVEEQIAMLKELCQEWDCVPIPTKDLALLQDIGEHIIEKGFLIIKESPCVSRLEIARTINRELHLNMQLSFHIIKKYENINQHGHNFHFDLKIRKK